MRRRVSRAQLGKRIQQLEQVSLTLEPLTDAEKKAFHKSYEYYQKTGKFTRDERGEFLRIFMDHF